MKLVVGLGNPGERYRATRHNAGAEVVREFVAESGAALRKGIFSDSSCVKVRVDTAELLLAVPLTYMNCSGPAVAALLRRHRIQPEDLLVVHDDIDLEFGRVKARFGGSAGGHNGIRSVIESVGTPEFCRLRIGVGRPPSGIDPADYVLSRFAAEEEKQIRETIVTACAAVALWAAEGISKTMNEFNR